LNGPVEPPFYCNLLGAGYRAPGKIAALQLRAMNIIYETTKERGATILMPSSMVDSMNPYGNTLALALAGNEVLKP